MMDLMTCFLVRECFINVDVSIQRTSQEDFKKFCSEMNKKLSNIK